VYFNLGLVGRAGAWFTLVRPVWRRCAGVAGARFTLTRIRLVLYVCTTVRYCVSELGTHEDERTVLYKT